MSEKAWTQQKKSDGRRHRERIKWKAEVRFGTRIELQSCNVLNRNMSCAYCGCLDKCLVAYFVCICGALTGFYTNGWKNELIWVKRQASLETGQGRCNPFLGDLPPPGRPWGPRGLASGRASLLAHLSLHFPYRAPQNGAAHSPGRQALYST